MSTVNAATTAQVRYVATLALRCGQLPSITSVIQPTLSASQFGSLKAKLNNQLAHATQLHGNSAPVAHQLGLLSAMSAVSGQPLASAPANRSQASAWAVAWFKANPALLVPLLSHLSAARASAASAAQVVGSPTCHYCSSKGPFASSFRLPSGVVAPVCSECV